MKRKIISAVIAFSLIVSGATIAYAGTIETKFTPTRTYENQFIDVAEGSWYYQYVKTAYEYGFVNGNSATTYNPDGNVSLAETLTIATQMNSIYTGKEIDRSGTSPWYMAFVNYAVENGIINKDAYVDYNAKATRAQFAEIMAAALPKEALAQIGTIDSIPDVSISDPCASAIYKLYNAGIVSGSDEYGTYNPTSNIRRSEVAVIAIKMANPELRRVATLKPVPNVKVNIKKADAGISYKIGQQSFTHNVSKYSDSYSAIIEIINTGSTPIYMDDCTFDIEDNNGHLLQTESLVSSTVDIIEPGKSGYFYEFSGFGIRLDESVSTDNGVKLVANISLEKSRQHATTYDLSDVSVRFESGRPKITGRVSNNTEKDDSLLYIVAIYFNDANEAIGITGTNVSKLTAGTTVSFEISGISLRDSVNENTVDHYVIIPQAIYYQW